MNLKILIISVVSLTYMCEAYKILLVISFPFKSHSILGDSIATLLLNAGHEVSYITCAPIASSHPNLTQIVINKYTYNAIALKTQWTCLQFEYIFNIMLKIVYSAVTHPNVQQLIEDTTQTFDLVITEWMYNDLPSGFSTVFNCPYIWFFTFNNDYEIMRLIHEVPNPLVTSNIKTNNIPPLTFLQRLQELIWLINWQFWKYFHYDPIELKTYEEVFGAALAKRGRNLPPYEEVRYNASLSFINTHSTIRDRPVVPLSYKNIGGFHIADTPEPLSQELLNIIEDSQKGIILFCLGSFLKSENMSHSVKTDLLAMFSELNYTTLWKIDERFQNLPSNVKVFPWLPVRSVLAHPKCVLFVTHGGILSLTESVHHGVPIVGMPVFGDQIMNMMTVVKRGVGKMVPMGPMMADDLKEAIKDVLSDPRYKENMNTLSALYHDRPVSPSSELLHWVEHVVATRGAPHLRSPALSVPWYQKIYADLAAILLVLLISFVFLIKNIFRCVVAKTKVMLDRNYGAVTMKKSL